MSAQNPTDGPPLFDRTPVKPTGILFYEARTRWVRTGDTFRVVARPVSWPMSLLFMAFGAVIVFLLVTQVNSLPPPDLTGYSMGVYAAMLLFVVLGGGVFLMGLSGLLDRVWFDKSSDRGRRFALLGPRWTVHASEIVAVQCLFVGWLKSGQRPHYQLNIALRSGTRVTVCDEPDEDLIRTTGAELADFLQVPLVDDIAATRNP
jgi:hypothetical protein